MMIHDLLDMSSGLSYPDDATEAGRAVGKIYEDFDAEMYCTGRT